MNNGNYGLIHDLLQSLMSSVQWTPCFINGARSSCERSRWLKRVIIQISVYPQEGGHSCKKARWRGVLSHLTAHMRTAAARQTENSFKRDGWSQERSSTHDEALCVQLLMCLWKIHSLSAKLQKKRYKQLKKYHLSLCCFYDKRNCTVIPLPQMIPLQLAVTCKWTRVPAGIR